MPQLWQCDVCGTPYRVNWLSHCYRCEGRPPKPRVKTGKPARRKRMPRIVAGVGPSNARAELEAQPGAAPVFEPLPEITEAVVEELQVSEPVAAAVEPEPDPVVAEVMPEPLVVPAPVVDVPVTLPKDGAQ